MPWGAAIAAVGTIGAAAINSSSKGGSPSGNTTSESSNAPWAVQQPYLQMGFQNANKLMFGTGAIPARAAGQFDATGNPKVDGGFDASGNPQAAVAAVAGTDPYTPQYFQGNTVQGWNPDQYYAEQGIRNTATQPNYLSQYGNQFSTQMMGGAYLNQNPGSQYEAGLASGNPIYDNPVLNSNNTWGPGGAISGLGSNAGNQALSGLFSSNAGNNAMMPWANGASLNNPGTGYLSGLAGGSASTNNPANSALSYLSSGAPTSNLPGSGALSAFANGSMLSAGNPYFSGLASSLGASVVPQIQKSFVDGGSMSNPAAAFATSQGLAAALAPYMEQNYTTGQANMLQAGTTLGAQQLQGLGLQGQAASSLGQNYLAGQQLAGTAGQNIAQNYLTGAGQAITAGQNIAGNNINTASALAQNTNTSLYNQGQIGLGQEGLMSQAYLGGMGIQQQAAANIGQNYNAGLTAMNQNLALAPQTQQLAYNPYNAMMQTGSLYQNQQQADLNGQIARWNYDQNMPFQMQNQFMQSIGGTGYGSQGSFSTPYYSNQAAGILQGVGGLAQFAGSPTGQSAINSLFGGGNQSYSGYNQVGLPGNNVSYNSGNYYGGSAPMDYATTF